MSTRKDTTQGWKFLKGKKKKKKEQEQEVITTQGFTLLS